MKADLVLIISKENTLSSQLAKIFGNDCRLGEFTTIGKDARYTYINSFTRSITIAYTTEEKLIG